MEALLGFRVFRFLTRILSDTLNCTYISLFYFMYVDYITQLFFLKKALKGFSYKEKLSYFVIFASFPKGR